MDIPYLSSLMDSATMSKLHKALANLELVVWLRKWGILEYRRVMEDAGYASHIALCTLTKDEADKVGGGES